MVPGNGGNLAAPSEVTPDLPRDAVSQKTGGTMVGFEGVDKEFDCTFHCDLEAIFVGIDVCWLQTVLNRCDLVVLPSVFSDTLNLEDFANTTLGKGRIA